MMRKLSLLALFSLTASCTAEPGGSIQLVHVMGPDQQCVYSTEGKDIRFDGFYDPTAANTMEVAVRINNSMNDKDSDPRSNDNNTNLKFSGNDVSMSGFNVCYKLESGISEFGAADSGHAFECDSVINTTSGEYREYVTGGGTVEADPKGQSEGSPVMMRLFSKDALQGLFGEAMIPEDLLTRASKTSVANCAADGVDANGLANGNCSETDTTAVTVFNNGTPEGFPWGEWPQDDRPSQYVLIVMQGVGITAAGSTVKTNWFSFSVQLCAGCTQVTGYTECAYKYRHKVCENDFGVCTYTNESDEIQEDVPCVSPKGKEDGQTGCPNNTTVCTGFRSEIVEYTPKADGSCDISQRLGTNVIYYCQEDDPCDDSEGASSE